MPSMRDRIRAFLQSQADAMPDLAESYQSFGSLQSQKLWHELTQELVTFVSNKANSRGDNFIKLYTEFIKTFETKLNKLKFVQIITKVASQYHVSNSENGLEDAVAFVQNISGCEHQQPPENIDASNEVEDSKADDKKSSDKENKKDSMDVDKKSSSKAEDVNAQKRRKVGEEGFVVCQVYVARMRFQQKRVEDCKYLLSQSKNILKTLSCADSSVHGCYYRLASEYHQAYGPAAEYYTDTLQFLVYTPKENLSDAEMLAFAIDLSLAALVGEGIYNFGEVLNLSIFSCLKTSSEFGWLANLLQAFNNGDIEKFNNIICDNRTQISQQPALRSPEAVTFLKEKIALLSLMQLIFALPANDRVVPFSVVANTTHLTIDKVEWLAIDRRAMALKLIEGSIDEVSQTMTITWVKPRVLDMSQLKSVATKLREWNSSVHSTTLFVEENTAELLDCHNFSSSN